MCGRLVVLLLALGLCMSSATRAADIILVTETGDTDADGVQDDLGLEDFLKGLGHEVDVRRGNWTTLDAGRIAELNAADLIVVSRRTSSGSYDDDAAEIANWSALKTPLILQSAYLARGTSSGYRWYWVNSTTINNLVTPMIQVVDLTHPIFKGVPLNASNQVDVVDGTTGSGQTSFTGTTDVGNGKLLARTATGTNTCIAEWEPGRPFYAGSPQTPEGKRMLFCSGTQESGATPQGAFNLTENGKSIFANAIRYMLGITAERGATMPSPADKATDVRPDVALTWTSGEYAATHDVYFGLDSADVAGATRTSPLGVLASRGQDANTYAPTDTLEFGRTYYWRVDEVNAPPDTTIDKGPVWSFTAEPFVYPVKNIVASASSAAPSFGPENTINGSGLDDDDLHSTADAGMWLSRSGAPQPTWIQYEFDRVYKLHEMWVWNYNISFEWLIGLGFRQVLVEYSTNGTDWTSLGEVEFVQAPSDDGYAHNTTVDFAGVAAQYVRLTAMSTWGGSTPQLGLSEVRFLHLPAHAREPVPASGATGVSPNVTLSWRPGREAASHQVYLSTDPHAVMEGTASVATPAEASYAPASLELGATYYWNVIEINEIANPPEWTSDLWSFSTIEYFVIDDFESYANESPDRIFQTWIDGYGYSEDEFFPAGNPGNGTGSAVGHDIWTQGGAHYGKTIVETTVVHDGMQSMPFYYDNSSVNTSEAARTWEIPQNWTAHEADTLTLYFHGNPVGFLQIAPDHFLMNGTGADIFGTADEGRFVYKRLSGDGSIIARIDRLDNTNAWANAGVMIRGTLDPAATWAYVVWAQENGARFRARLTVTGSATSDTPVATDDQKAVRPPAWVKIERKGDQFNGYYAMGETVTTWTPMVWNPQTIVMSPDVYIGLAVTSHAAGLVTQAEFSGVATTGKVTGEWQSASLGVEQPAGNAPETLYVTLEDSSGHEATVVNADPYAVGVGAWTPWSFPLSEFSSGGVKTNSIRRMTIGLGDEAKAASGASGLIYIDDIGYGRPAPSQP
ncbi:MAG: discoidin domain-containing protein [Sedimentisphaerales bacterium]|nr:discoidin domain-containing protein [Sedimentisphaerales bacterium]